MAAETTAKYNLYVSSPAFTGDRAYRPSVLMDRGDDVFALSSFGAALLDANLITSFTVLLGEDLAQDWERDTAARELLTLAHERVTSVGRDNR